MKATTKVRLAILSMTLVTIAWGGAFVGIKVLLRTVNYIDLTLLRFLFSSLILLALLPRYKPEVRLQRSDWGLIVLLGALGVGGYHLSLNFGERTVSAGVASLIISAVPVMVAILAPFFIGEKSSRRKTLGILVALLGVVILIVRGTPGVELEVGSLVGAAVIAIAPLSWAFNTVLSRPLTSRIGATPITILMILAGTAMILPLARSSTVEVMAVMTLAEWAWLAYLVVPCTVGGYLIWFWALRQLDATRTATFVYLVPLWGLIWAYFALGEKLTLWVGIGGICVLGGIYLVQGKVRDRGPVAPQPHPKNASATR